LISTPPDPFEEWFRMPVTEGPADSPFLVRRAPPSEFERVYDTVDAAFGRKRPRALYDWLYRQNPGGTAQSWVVEERASGTILKVGTNFPWPIRHGDECLMGLLGGDAATLPEWQRKGLSAIRRKVTRTHPWYDRMCAIAGPNAGSRALIRKSGRSPRLLGRLRGGIAMLQSGAVLEKVGVPALLASPAGRVADALFSTLPARRRSRAKIPGISMEQVSRFTPEFDAATEKHMRTNSFWCPHNSDFLNWRYLDHPDETYVARVMLEADRPEGYSVLRIAGNAATLSEFVASTSTPSHAVHLLGDAMHFAREAGCAYLNFFSTSQWRHWPLFRRAGFLPYRSQNEAEAGCKRYGPEAQIEANWQLLPGDRDYH
jgi:hypothetical protein